MVPSELIKAKEIPNTRILVEQVIWQVKAFKILAYELPISVIRYIDDVLGICCTLVT